VTTKITLQHEQHTAQTGASQ